jgi:hypothetical protein
MIQARNQNEAESTICCLLHTDFLFGLIFNLKDGSDMFLRNVS